MRKLIGVAGLLLVSLSVGVQGCGGDDDDDDTASATGGNGGGGDTGGTDGTGDSGVCATLCDFDPGLDCPGDTPRSTCMEGCGELLSLCPAETEAYVNCVVAEPASSFECGDTGYEPVAGLCATENSELMDCVESAEGEGGAGGAGGAG